MIQAYIDRIGGNFQRAEYKIRRPSLLLSSLPRLLHGKNDIIKWTQNTESQLYNS